MYIASNLADHEGRVVGSGHCVALVREACQTGHTSQWKPGKHVLSSDVPFGTAIATFDTNDRYANATDGSSHAAIFIEQQSDGFKVLDQWIGRAATYRVIRTKNGVGPACDDASRYYIIELSDDD